MSDSSEHSHIALWWLVIMLLGASCDLDNKVKQLKQDIQALQEAK
jgi:hypothetical protein